MWGDDFDIDTLFGGESEGVHNFAIANEVRSSDAEGLGGAVNEVEVDVFGDRMVIDGRGAGAINSGETRGFGG